ncbi:hypothetical protein QTO34_002986 [Cnephaeus nilssonii]|uniref:Rec21/ENK19 domain-containing protein n=1 Tax=Cnephaeus nilssonii TaxID=3371016 RepID=A0AA40HT41_CNENI|nr:hypothetical protein QTO34_002986 [Eptesicus nilssonii]
MGKRNNSQRKENVESPRKEISENEACNMTEKEFRVMVMEFIHRMDEKINNLCKNQEEMKSDIATIKNTMESFNSRLQEAEDRISELEDQVQKQAQAEQQLEKKIKKQEESLRELRDNMKRSSPLAVLSVVHMASNVGPEYGGIIIVRKQRSRFGCQGIVCITAVDPEKLLVPPFKRLRVALMIVMRKKITKATQGAEVPTWGQLNKLMTEAQQMVEKRGVEATPSATFLAMLALVSCQSSVKSSESEDSA